MENQKLCRAEGTHLLRSCTEKIKIGILVKLGLYAKVKNLCHRFRDFLLFLCYTIAFYTEIFALDFSSLLIVRTNNLAIF